jgi:hypothetical protein
MSRRLAVQSRAHVALDQTARLTLLRGA